VRADASNRKRGKLESDAPGWASVGVAASPPSTNTQMTNRKRIGPAGTTRKQRYVRSMTSRTGGSVL
jgi:hypothetical protein